MQTFLPYPDFLQSARCLDYKRLGKQRVEVKQLLLALGHAVGQHTPKNTWANHPAARMWAAYPEALAYYGFCVCVAWRERGYNDSLLPQFELFEDPAMRLPSWLGDPAFHRSHQSNLKRKDPEYYNFDVPNNLEYIWPC